MIIRKMRNNVVKKIPKDFDSALTAEQYNMMDDTYREVHAEIEDFANSTVFDTDFKEVPEPDHEPEPSQPVEEKEEPSEKKEPAPEKEEPNGADALETPEWLQ